MLLLKTSWSSVALVLVGLFAACGESDDKSASGSMSAAGSAGTGSGGTTSAPSSSQTIGTTGGTLKAGTVELTVPPDAVDADTTITVREESIATPGFEPLTPIYHFEPETLQFAKPVQVSFALNNAPAGATVYWRGAGKTTFETLESTYSAGKFVATTLSLGVGFVGLASIIDNGQGGQPEPGTGGAPAAGGSTSEAGAPGAGGTPSVDGNPTVTSVDPTTFYNCPQTFTVTGTNFSASGSVFVSFSGGYEYGALPTTWISTTEAQGTLSGSACGAAEGIGFVNPIGDGAVDWANKSNTIAVTMAAGG